MIWKKIVKFEIVILIIGALLVFTMPILAREIDERAFSADDYIRVRMALPINKTVKWSGELPKIAIKNEFKKIVIDLSEQKLFTYEAGKMTGEYSVSSGKRGMETPTGEFQIYTKNKRRWSKMASLWMPYWMMIDPSKGIGIHELPEWPNGYKEGANHLGTPVSHGCIRLGVGPAETVYKWADEGTKVEIIE